MSQEKHLEKAGILLLQVAIAQAKTVKLTPKRVLDNRKYRSLLTEARLHLVNVDPLHDPHRFGAVKTALEACEAIERGEDPVGATLLFSGFVEGVLGGERKMDLGGKKRVSRKPSVTQTYLRAAFCKLWEMDKILRRRDLLVKEARTYLNIRNKRAAAKLVDNFNQKHDTNVVNSNSPKSVHIRLIKELIDSYGYKKLTDFV